MEISRDALLRIVKASRMAIRLAEDTQKLMLYKKPVSIADCITGHLTDALVMISGEELTPEQNFNLHSRTVQLLTGTLSDWEVTDCFIQMAEEHEAKQPAPNVISAKEITRMVNENGGYLYEPDKKPANRDREIYILKMQIRHLKSQLRAYAMPHRKVGTPK